MSTSNSDLPQSRNHRFVFIFSVSFICAVLYILDYHWLTPASLDSTSETLKNNALILKSVVENLIAGAIAALLLAITYRWVVAWIDPTDRVIEVPPVGITDRLLDNARITRNYVFIGNTAGFVSSAILPILTELARKSGHPRVISLFLIDPIDESAVDAYVAYRERVAKGTHKSADSEEAMWVRPVELKIDTPDEVVAKILAAVYVAAYASLYPGVNVAVYLRRSFTPFRADISDGEAVLTQESPLESAVAFSSRGHFYGWYQKEAEAQKGQSVSFDFTLLRDVLRRLRLAHPTASSSELEKSLRQLISKLPHLSPIAHRVHAISIAAKLIGKPNLKYR